MVDTRISLQPSRKKNQKWAMTIFILGAFVILLVLTHTSWLPLFGKFLVVRDPLERADAVLSLAGDQRRPRYAAELFLKGYARWFIITPLPLDSQRERDLYIRYVKHTALRMGVPEEAILLVPEVGNTTFEEAKNVKRFLEQNNINSLLVVTSPWHTRRSRLIFQDVFKDSNKHISIQPMSDNVYGHWSHTYRPEEWWTYRLGRDPTLSEYVKLAVYLIGIR
jgi:uncharacterized SAM-binding protein YcdF (DUF218 family)